LQTFQESSPAGRSRAGFYGWRVPCQATQVEMEIRDQMQKVALESSEYGYRRVTAELRPRGFGVNHKRVLRMVREDDLLCVLGAHLWSPPIPGPTCRSIRTWQAP
jgi:hypothetical protein